MDLARLAGQLFVVGFDGQDLPPSIARALSEGRRGGVILFRRNLPSLESTRSLTTAIAAAAPRDEPPFVAVDEEGGRVTRLPAPAERLPPMRRLGEIGDAALVERAGAAVGRTLATLGFNLDFAPVLDVDSNPANPIIGDRAFAREPALVASLAAAFAVGLRSSGIAACGKHYPGHGDTSLDSHLALPRVEHDRARLEAIELAPFRSVGCTLPTLMTAHVVYDALDPGVPATLSRRVATELLRNELGFEGVLFSDDLEMKALSDRMTYEESAVRAIAAGCDVLLVCHEADAQERAHAALIREAERSPNFRARCEQAARRSLAVRRAHPPVSADGELRRRVAASGVASVLAEDLDAR